MAAPRFEVVPEETDRPAVPESGQAAAVLFLALKALSQRALAALADLFCLLTVGSGFVLWMSLPDPNAYQLVSMGMYAAFVLAANVIVRRK